MTCNDVWCVCDGWWLFVGCVMQLTWIVMMCMMWWSWWCVWCVMIVMMCNDMYDVMIVIMCMMWWLWWCVDVYDVTLFLTVYDSQFSAISFWVASELVDAATDKVILDTAIFTAAHHSLNHHHNTSSLIKLSSHHIFPPLLLSLFKYKSLTHHTFPSPHSSVSTSSSVSLSSQMCVEIWTVLIHYLRS